VVSGKESKVNVVQAQRRGMVGCVEVEVEGRGTVILQHAPAQRLMPPLMHAIR
jgi:hypothetical protein